jgi:hypothetical protein
MILRTEQGDDYWAVWLEPEDGDVYVGICVATGVSEAIALRNATDELAAMRIQAETMFWKLKGKQ